MSPMFLLLNVRIDQNNSYNPWKYEYSIPTIIDKIVWTKIWQTKLKTPYQSPSSRTRRQDTNITSLNYIMYFMVLSTTACTYFSIQNRNIVWCRFWHLFLIPVPGSSLPSMHYMTVQLDKLRRTLTNENVRSKPQNKNQL